MTSDAPEHGPIMSHIPRVFGAGTAMVVAASTSSPPTILVDALCDAGWNVVLRSEDDATPSHASIVLDTVSRSLTDLDERATWWESLLDDGGLVFVRIGLANRLTFPLGELWTRLRHRLPTWAFRMLYADALNSDDVWVRASRRRPLAFLLLGAPLSGKSNSSHTLAESGITTHHGDLLLRLIAEGAVHASPHLCSAAQKGYAAGDWSVAIGLLGENHVLDELCDLVISRSEPGRDVCFDMMVPAEYQEMMVLAFAARGYWPVVMSTGLSASLDVVSNNRRISDERRRATAAESEAQRLHALSDELTAQVSQMSENLAHLRGEVAQLQDDVVRLRHHNSTLKRQRAELAHYRRSPRLALQVLLTRTPRAIVTRLAAGHTRHSRT